MRADKVDLNLYTEGMSYLARSGVFEFLKQLGRVKDVPLTSPNYALVHIAELHRSRGYLTALDNLYSFKESFVDVAEGQTPPLDYGGIKTLLNSNRITEKEAHELRTQFPSSDRE